MGLTAQMVRICKRYKTGGVPAGIVTKRIQGARGYMSLRKDDLDRRFPGLIDSIVSADSETVP